MYHMACNEGHDCTSLHATLHLTTPVHASLAIPAKHAISFAAVELDSSNKPCNTKQIKLIDTLGNQNRAIFGHSTQQADGGH
jgi:hypothetical protein